MQRGVLPRILGLTIGVLMMMAPPAVSGETCRSSEYEIRGIVLGAGGRPLAGANVYGLLDRTSEKKFMQQGIRARRTRTDASGRFALKISCGTQNDLPNPCASKRRHLTLLVDPGTHTMQLREFKLKALDSRREGERCVVDVPSLRIAG